MSLSAVSRLLLSLCLLVLFSPIAFAPGSGNDFEANPQFEVYPSNALRSELVYFNVTPGRYNGDYGVKIYPNYNSSIVTNVCSSSCWKKPQEIINPAYFPQGLYSGNYTAYAVGLSAGLEVYDCKINDVYYKDYDRNPGNYCQICQYSNPHSWSNYEGSCMVGGAPGQCTGGTCVALTCPSGTCSESNKCDYQNCNNQMYYCTKPAGATAYAWSTSNSCDDGNACTTGDYCNANSQCVGGTALAGCTSCTLASQCDDSNSCTVDSCANGQCAYAQSSDGSACNGAPGKCCGGVCDSDNVVSGSSYSLSCRSTGEYCLGAGNWGYSALASGTPCGTTPCQSAYCSGTATSIVWNLFPQSCGNFCSNGLCSSCTCSSTSTSCTSGGCCTASCNDATGCSTYAASGSCADVCTSTALTTGKVCSGCGANGATGACSAGTTYTCDSLNNCAQRSCNGIVRYCSNEGGVWAWRQSVPLSCGKICSISPSSATVTAGTSKAFNVSCTDSGVSVACPSLSWSTSLMGGTFSPSTSSTSSVLFVSANAAAQPNGFANVIGGGFSCVAGVSALPAQPPKITLLHPANASFANATPVFSINATDDNSPMLDCIISAWREGNIATTMRSISNSSVYNATRWNYKFDQFIEGKWEWSAQCRDANGAVDTAPPNKFFVDPVPPRVNASWPANVYNGSIVVFYANVSETNFKDCGFYVNNSLDAFMLKENKTSYWLASYGYFFQAPGAFNVSIKCFDKAGNTGLNYTQVNVNAAIQLQQAAASPTPTPSPNASVTPAPVPNASITPLPNASITPTPAPTANATATPVLSISPTATPVSGASPSPTISPSHFERRIDGQNSVSADLGVSSSSFNLSYTAGASGFEGTISYRLPFDYALFEEGKISFSPVPSTVTQGSIIAYWQASLAPQQAFIATLNVAEVFNESILQQFTAAMLDAATPTPGPAQTATPTATPFATPTPLPVTSLQPVAIGTGTLIPPKEFSENFSAQVVRPAIKVQSGESEAKAKAESFIVNITNFVTDSEKVPFGPVEFGGNGTVFSTTNLSEITCEGKTECSCKFTTSFIAEGGQNTTWFRCIFQPIVNGSYSIIVSDQYDHLGKYNLSLVPGRSPVLFRVVETAAATDPLFTALLVLVLLSMVSGTAYLVREKMESEKNKRLALFNRKAQIENDFKMLKYRYLKRELDDVAFKKIWDAKEKEYSDVKARLLEQQEKEKKGKTQQ